MSRITPRLATFIAAPLGALVLGTFASSAGAEPRRGPILWEEHRHGPRGGPGPYDEPGPPREDADRDGRPDRYDRPDRYGRPDRYDRPDDRGRPRRGAHDDFGPRRYRPSWIALSTPARLPLRGELFIPVTERGTFTQVRVQAVNEDARIERVIVEFADGSDQVLDVHRVLDDRNDYIDVPLDGNNRHVTGIIVTGATDRRGGIEVFAI